MLEKYLLHVIVICDVKWLTINISLSKAFHYVSISVIIYITYLYSYLRGLFSLLLGG